MVQKCKHCGDLAVEDDEQVCKSCGVVIEDIQFNVDFFQPRGKLCVPVNRVGAMIMKKSKPPYGLTYGLEALKNMCHAFSLPPTRESMASELLKDAYKNRAFKKKEDISALAGCCIFFLEKGGNQPISVYRICQELSCQKRRFSAMLKYLKSWVAFHRPDLVKESNVDSMLSSDNQCKPTSCEEQDVYELFRLLVEEVCDKVDEAKKEQLIKKTCDLVKLSYSCWLYTGRIPRSIVVACTFLCWKSMSHTRKKFSFNKFCSEFGIREPMARSRLSELKTLLLKLGRKIPTHSKDYVHEKNLIFHLDTIIENSETLRNDLLLREEFKEEVVNCREYSSFRVPPRKIPAYQEITSATSSLSNSSDVEISDTEIESYIRSDLEVQMVKKLKKT